MPWEWGSRAVSPALGPTLPRGQLLEQLQPEKWSKGSSTRPHDCTASPV